MIWKVVSGLILQRLELETSGSSWPIGPTMIVGEVVVSLAYCLPHDKCRLRVARRSLVTLVALSVVSLAYVLHAQAERPVFQLETPAIAMADCSFLVCLRPVMSADSTAQYRQNC